MLLYRFELAFCGEPQDVGFLQGLEDAGFAPDGDLYKQFDDLAIPSLTDLDGPVSFLFTAAGLQRFQKRIDRVIRALEKRGWQMLGTRLDLDPTDAVYQDEDQMAFYREYVKDFLPQYTEISNVRELLRL